MEPSAEAAGAPQDAAAGDEIFLPSPATSIPTDGTIGPSGDCEKARAQAQGGAPATSIPTDGTIGPSGDCEKARAQARGGARRWPSPVQIPKGADAEAVDEGRRRSDADCGLPPTEPSGQWPRSAPLSGPSKIPYKGSNSFSEGGPKHSVSAQSARTRMVSPLLDPSAASSPDKSPSGKGSSPRRRNRQLGAKHVLPLSLAGDGPAEPSGSNPGTPHSTDSRGSPAGPRTPPSGRAMRRCCPTALFALMRTESWQPVRSGAHVYSRHTSRSKIHNTIKVPWKLEGLLSLGTLMCLDSYLFLFTLFPLRLLSAILHALPRLVPIPYVRDRCFRSLRADERVDIVRGAFLFICTAGLLWFADISKAYHIIRGQATIKLYVIYNVLEICDKMCCFIGQDVLDAAFLAVSGSHATSSRTSGGSSPVGWLRQALLGPTRGERWIVMDLLLATIYVAGHSAVLLYQVVTLQVAMNSVNNALFTLMISNNFVELKGSVFKKFEKDNLFQIAYADMTERFQLGLFLVLIVMQQLAGALPSGSIDLEDLPSFLVELARAASAYGWQWLRGGSAGVVQGAGGKVGNEDENAYTVAAKQLGWLPITVIFLWIFEIIVDWVKHAFIIKFNHIMADTYSDFSLILSGDIVLANSDRGTAYLDRPHASSHRICFSSLPRAVLALRMLGPSLVRHFWLSPAGIGQRGDGSCGSATLAVICFVLLWLCLLLIKTLLSVHILATAQRRVAKSTAFDQDSSGKASLNWQSESESEVQPQLRDHSRSPVQAGSIVAHGSPGNGKSAGSGKKHRTEKPSSGLREARKGLLSLAQKLDGEVAQS